MGSRVVQFSLNGFESIGVNSMLFIVLHLRVSSGLSALAAIVNVSVFGCRLKSFHGIDLLCIFGCVLVLLF